MDYGRIILCFLLLVYFIERFSESKTKQNIFMIALSWYGLFYTGNYNLSSRLPFIPKLILLIFTVVTFLFLYREYKLIRSRRS